MLTMPVVLSSSYLTLEPREISTTALTCIPKRRVGWANVFCRFSAIQTPHIAAVPKAILQRRLQPSPEWEPLVLFPSHARHEKREIWLACPTRMGTLELQQATAMLSTARTRRQEPAQSTLQQDVASPPGFAKDAYRLQPMPPKLECQAGSPVR